MSFRVSRPPCARFVTTTRLLLIFAVMSCDSPTELPGQSDERLPHGVAALVGAEPVQVSIVERIAEERRVDKQLARDLAVQDALFAAAARVEFQGTGVVPVTERAAWARAILEILREQAEKQGTPTDGEIHEVVQAKWQQYDRPESVKTVHAVVLAAAPKEVAKARQVAERLREAVAGHGAAAEFTKAARGVDAAGLELRVEKLPAVTRDGRVIYTDEPLFRRASESNRFDESYARAANAIFAVGDQSGIVQTSHGFHIILLTERLPEKRHSKAELFELLANDVYAKRAAKLLENLVAQISRHTAVEITRAVDQLTSHVQVSK